MVHALFVKGKNEVTMNTIDRGQEVKTTCPYCGVGCGVLASCTQSGEVIIKGDSQHPANFGRLCSKGTALGQTVSLEGRLLYPEINGEQCSWTSALDTVANTLGETVARYGPESIAFYVSGQLLTEDYYVANKLMKGFIGSANIDTNSRLCMSSSVAGHKRAFGSDTVPCAYEDLERAKLIVLVGSNTAWCHPVLFQRISQAKKDNPDLCVVVIDPRRTATCEIADLHLPIKSGMDAVLFNGLFVYLDEHDEKNKYFVNYCTEAYQQARSLALATAPTIESVAARCGLRGKDVAEFYRIFSRTERVVSVYSQGVNQSSSGTDKVNAMINCHLLTGRIGRPGMGPFSLTGQPNAMGGREVGGLSNQLAAHMDIHQPQHRDCVQRFWHAPALVSKEGLMAVDLFKAVDAGQIKAVWIMATNPVVSMPEADSVRGALKKCDFVVVSDCVAKTDTTAMANVVLPALAWGEKNGTVTNSERCISRQRAFLPVPGEAKADWWMICEVAKRMGFAESFDYASVADIFREHAALSGFENEGERDFNISGLDQLTDAEYERLMPSQWPIVEKGHSTPRMFGEGRFYTASGRAQFVGVEPQLPKNLVDEKFPFLLNTGRVRDQWHTMTRTGKSSRLAEHSPEPYAEIHPEDATKHGLEDGSLVHVFSRWGEIIVRVRTSADQQKGCIFVPMHWNGQFSSSARVDALVNAAVDPVSGQPEFKNTPVRIVEYKPAWHGFLLSRRKLNIDEANYWVLARGEGFYRYELAGEQAPENWPAWVRQLLCTQDNDVDWVEYLDKASRKYRGVRIVNKRVDSCIFIGPSHTLPPRSWLGSLFTKSVLSEGEQKSLLLGQPPKGEEDVGRIVCACFGVGVNTLTRTIAQQKLTTVAQIGDALQAGTNCGSCVPELKRLLS